MTIIFFGILSLISHLNTNIKNVKISATDFSNPLVAFRVVLAFLASFFYTPFIFWILINIRKSFTDSEYFTQQYMGWTTLIIGLLMLCFSQGPAFFVPEWLQGKWANIYHTLYGMGWCLILGGIFCFKNMRTFILQSHFAVGALAIGVGWWLLALIGPKLSPTFVVWPVIYVLSIVLAFLGQLSLQKWERWIAFVGLVLIGVYFFMGGHSWLSLRYLLDPRFMTPFNFVNSLAWLTAVGQFTGFFKRFGNPLDNS